MKTFETEKHNIPEGATHYSDECESYRFTWFLESTDGEVYLFSDLTKDWTLSLFNRELKPIPQTNIETPEEKTPELTRDDSPQGVISAISNRLHNMGCEHQDSELGEELGSMARDMWGVLPLISNEPIKEEKPRTKVEYVKVTDSFFDLQSDFEAGELFSKVNHARDYSAINNTQTLAQTLHQMCCYRRIETPMTEREVFIEAASKALPSFDKKTTPIWAGKLYDSGMFKLVK